MLRVSDPGVFVAKRTGDGWPAVVTRTDDHATLVS